MVVSVCNANPHGGYQPCRRFNFNKQDIEAYNKHNRRQGLQPLSG
jgi:hypothetical protein